MFTYLISPKTPSDPSYFIALTVNKNTITAYIQNRSAALSEDQNKMFIQCIRTLTSSKKVHFVQPQDADHAIYHSNKYYNGESSLIHTHIKHEKQIRLKDLKQFLKKLQTTKACQEWNLNHKLIQDILRKYKEFYEKNKHADLEYTGSNNLIYSNSNHSMPSISSHAFCLRLFPDKIGCERASPPLITQKSSELVSEIPDAAQAPLLALTAGTLLLFCLFRGKINHSKQLDDKPVASEKNKPKMKIVA